MKISETTQAAHTAIESILASVGVTFSCLYRGETNRAYNEDQNQYAMDEWLTTFSKGRSREDFQYFTGLGHRTKAILNLHPPRVNTLAWHAWQKTCKPVKPHAASVLYCLLLDSSVSGQSFAHWCSDFSYDTDSRKALATYELCQQTTDKLAKLFDTATREALQTALQDY